MPRLRVGGFKVLLHLVGGPRRGGAARGRRELLAVAQRRLRNLQLLALAVALHDAALHRLRKGVARRRRVPSVDAYLDRVGLVGHGAGDTVLADDGERAGGVDAELAAGGEVVGLCDVDADLDGLAGGDALDCRVLDLAGGDSLLDAKEWNSVIFGRGSE